MLEEELAAAKARIAELEKAAQAITNAPGAAKTVERLKKTNERLEFTIRHQTLEIARLQPDSVVRAMYAKDREIAQLKEENAQLKARIAANKQMGEQPTTKPADPGKPKIQLSEADYKKLARDIHPNRWDHLQNEELTKALNNAFQIVGTVFEAVKKERRSEAEARARQEEHDRKWRAEKRAERQRREAAAPKAAATRKANAAKRAASENAKTAE